MPVPSGVFITGASGFIGRALAARFRAAGARVRGMDRAPDPAADVVAGDVGQPGPWQAHAEGCELVIHTAAVVSLRLERPGEVWQANVAGTANALDAAERAGASRFVHFSSITAFGLEFPDGADERHPVRPSGIPYTDTKIASEQVVLQAHAEGRVPVTVIRPGDVYGPASRAWAIVPFELMRAGRFVLPARGEGVFSPVYIDNLVDGVTAAAAADAAVGQVFTLTDGAGVRARTFFEPYARLAGRPLRAVPTPVAVAVAGAVQAVARAAPGDNDVNPLSVRYLARTGTYSIAKARAVLGYAPRVGLEEGQRRSLAWLREHYGP